MDSGTILRLARERSGLSLRALAAQAGTSHSALAAYEAGRVHPSYEKVFQILASTGFDLEVTLVPRSGRNDEDQGRASEGMLTLAEQFPAPTPPS